MEAGADRQRIEALHNEVTEMQRTLSADRAALHNAAQSQVQEKRSFQAIRLQIAQERKVHFGQAY